jgi:hypothetical protein
VQIDLGNVRMNYRNAKFTLCLIAGVLLPTHASAVIVNTLPTGVTVSPVPFSEVRSSDDSNTDIGSQNPANVEAALESSDWFNTPLTFVGGGACGVAPSFSNNCSAFENGTKGGTSNLEATVFGVHYGNNFIAVLYSDAVSDFTIDGLSNGVSNIYAFNGSVSQVPLPAAFPLFLMALGILGLAGWRRRKVSAAA